MEYACNSVFVPLDESADMEPFLDSSILDRKAIFSKFNIIKELGTSRVRLVGPRMVCFTTRETRTFSRTSLLRAKEKLRSSSGDIFAARCQILSVPISRSLFLSVMHPNTSNTKGWGFVCCFKGFRLRLGWKADYLSPQRYGTIFSKPKPACGS